ncbi:chromosome segregation protein Spc25-domain-containing protein [Desarmillaria tabescens]|uniref:Kinetochore protein SPC25 n=1 Tax=Armillaria tabescens TaxID=1929756 RepID=A0AA39NI95_ARMTA|nr:chromosome segregation protein Spc25-domain-containing protein [Desarmillaria tabescens]KAK0466141.1 chromosome segregation protein Spc25-domain-containing protein [Desarmillaria tabescens]
MATGFRVPQIDLSTVLQADHPIIDLRLESYEDETRNFLKDLTGFKELVITQETEGRAAFAAEMKRLAEKSKEIEAETNQCKVREIELLADLDREAQERKDAEYSVATFRRQLASLKEKCAAIDGELEEYRAITANLEREREKERSTLQAHASSVQPDYQTLERILGLTIEGIDKEQQQLLVRFRRIDLDDLEKEFSFVLDVSGPGYKVLTSSPPLPQLPFLVEELNLTKDIFAFIHAIRQAYVKLVRG